MKDIATKINEAQFKERTISLPFKVKDTVQLLTALGYTYHNKDDAQKWERTDYEDLYYKIYKESKEIFGVENLEEFVPNNIDDCKDYKYKF